MAMHALLWCLILLGCVHGIQSPPDHGPGICLCGKNPRLFVEVYSVVPTLLSDVLMTLDMPGFPTRKVGLPVLPPFPSLETHYSESHPAACAEGHLGERECWPEKFNSFFFFFQLEFSSSDSDRPACA